MRLRQLHDGQRKTLRFEGKGLQFCASSKMRCSDEFWSGGGSDLRNHQAQLLGLWMVKVDQNPSVSPECSALSVLSSDENKIGERYQSFAELFAQLAINRKTFLLPLLCVFRVVLTHRMYVQLFILACYTHNAYLHCGPGLTSMFLSTLGFKLLKDRATDFAWRVLSSSLYLR